MHLQYYFNDIAGKNLFLICVCTCVFLAIKFKVAENSMNHI